MTDAGESMVYRKTMNDALNHLDDKQGLTSSKLFDLVDTDTSGQISKDEFAKMYNIIRSHIETEHKHEKDEHEKTLRAQKRTRFMGMVSLVLVIFLGISIAGNAATSYAVGEALKDTTTEVVPNTGGAEMLTDHKTGALLHTASEPVVSNGVPANLPEQSAAYLRGITELNFTLPVAGQPVVQEIILKVNSYKKLYCSGPNCDPKTTSMVLFHCDGADVIYYYTPSGDVEYGFSLADGFVQDALDAMYGTNTTTAAGRRQLAEKEEKDAKAMAKHLGELAPGHPLHQLSLQHARRGRTLWLPVIMAVGECALNPLCVRVVTTVVTTGAGWVYDNFG
jgi:hypothetical protein